MTDRTSRVRVVINGLHAMSGGGVTYLRNVLSPLADDQRLELHLFLHADQHHLYGEIDERVRVHLFDFRSGFFRLLAWEQLVLPIRARAISADVTFSPANYGPLFAPAPVLLLRNALAVIGREGRLAKRLYWLGLALMTAICLLGCRRAIAVSNYARRALSFGLGGWLERKVSTVYHGVGDKFCPGDPASRDALLVLAVADIYVQKNLHTLIAALAAVRARVPGAKLKIAGRRIDSGYYERLAASVQSHNLQDSVEFLGECSVDALVRLYRSCAVFVFPSTVETFGNPLIEAMACGAPIACSRAAAMPEIAGDAAVYFDPMDAADVAEKIVALLLDRDLARRMAEIGRARAGQFSWAEAARKTADVLVMSARRKAPAAKECRARAF